MGDSAAIGQPGQGLRKVEGLVVRLDRGSSNLPGRIGKPRKRELGYGGLKHPLSATGNALRLRTASTLPRPRRRDPPDLILGASGLLAASSSRSPSHRVPPRGRSSWRSTRPVGARVSCPYRYPTTGSGSRRSWLRRATWRCRSRSASIRTYGCPGSREGCGSSSCPSQAGWSSIRECCRPGEASRSRFRRDRSATAPSTTPSTASRTRWSSCSPGQTPPYPSVRGGLPLRPGVGAPGSDFIAFEPMTAPINPFESERMLLVEPGSRYRARFEIGVTA